MLIKQIRLFKSRRYDSKQDFNTKSYVIIKYFYIGWTYYYYFKESNCLFLWKWIIRIKLRKKKYIKFFLWPKTAASQYCTRTRYNTYAFNQRYIIQNEQRNKIFLCKDRIYWRGIIIDWNITKFTYWVLPDKNITIYLERIHQKKILMYNQQSFPFSFMRRFQILSYVEGNIQSSKYNCLIWPNIDPFILFYTYKY